MKKTLTLISLILFVGCSKSVFKTCAEEANQQLRRELFQACLKSIPAGPTHTVSNDWSEVVESCGSQAYYQSFEKPKNCQ